MSDGGTGGKGGGISVQGRIRAGFRSSIRGRDCAQKYQTGAASISELQRDDYLKSMVVASGHVSLMRIPADSPEESSAAAKDAEAAGAAGAEGGAEVKSEKEEGAEARAVVDCVGVGSTHEVVLLRGLPDAARLGHEDMVRHVLLDTPQLMAKVVAGISSCPFLVRDAIAEIVHRDWHWAMTAIEEAVQHDVAGDAAKKQHFAMICLRAAARAGSLSAVQHYLDHPGLLDNMQTYDRADLVTEAAYGGSVEVFNLLEQRNALTIAGTNSGDAVCSAAERGHLAFLQHMHNRTDDFANAISESTMDWAAKNGQLRIIEWLHENGTSCSDSAMTWAAFGGHVETVQFLHETLSASCRDYTVERVATLSPAKACQVVQYLVTHDLCSVTPLAIINAVLAQNKQPALLELFHKLTCDKGSPDVWEEVMNSEEVKHNRDAREQLEIASGLVQDDEDI